MTSVLLTSFQRSAGLVVQAYSAAVYQPSGYALPKCPWADIRPDGSSEWTRPRNFVSNPEPLACYNQALRDIYESRRAFALAWLEAVGSCALCCWCPYDRAAQRQLEEHGTFVCHTAVLADKLEEWGVRVWLDTDRQLMKKLPRRGVFVDG